MRHAVHLQSSHIPNRHFPTWKVKVLPPIAFPAALLSFPIPERVQLPDGRPHGFITPAASRLVVYPVRWRIHSIATRTRNNYESLNPWRIRSLVSLVWAASRARDSISYGAMLPFYSYSVFKFVLSVNPRVNPTWVLVPDSVFFHPSNSELFLFLRRWQYGISHSLV